MSSLHERIGFRLRAELCPNCVRYTRDSTCSLPPGRECALFANLDKIVDVVRTTRSRRIDPYVDALRQAVCASCGHQDDTGRCPCRDGIDCALDCYFPMVRELVPHGKMLFIVNDRCDLALAVEADGVHLGQEDLPVALARTILGKNRVIGLSTHHAEQVRAASQEKPDYLGFGPIFPTKSKTQHEPVVGVEGLANIRHLTTLPVFAIGGISASAIPRLREAGADGVAVASGILGAPDRRIAFRQFMDPYRQGT